MQMTLMLPNAESDLMNLIVLRSRPSVDIINGNNNWIARCKHYVSCPRHGTLHNFLVKQLIFF